MTEDALVRLAQTELALDDDAVEVRRERVPLDGLRRLSAVRKSGRIAEIDQRLVRKLARDLTKHRQPADTAVENADGPGVTLRSAHPPLNHPHA